MVRLEPAECCESGWRRETNEPKEAGKARLKRKNQHDESRFESIESGDGRETGQRRFLKQGSYLSTARHPTAGQPTAGQPTASQPTAGRPTAGRPTAGRPTAGRPTSSQRTNRWGRTGLGKSPRISYGNWTQPFRVAGGSGLWVWLRRRASPKTHRETFGGSTQTAGLTRRVRRGHACVPGGDRRRLFASQTRG